MKKINIVKFLVTKFCDGGKNQTIHSLPQTFPLSSEEDLTRVLIKKQRL